MDIRQLRTFIQVAQTRSITRAAAALHIAQPALSRQLKLLEAEFGESLFERSERGVTLTSLGERFLLRATDVVRDFDSLKTDFSRRSEGPSGNVRFGVPKSLMESYVAPALADFHCAYPAIAISLTDGTTIELREQISAGCLDLAIVSDLDRSPGARMQPLLCEPLVMASHPASGLRMSEPVSPETVAGQAIAVPSRPNIVRLTLDERLRREGLTPRVEFETDSHMAARVLACSGTIPSVMPFSAIVGELEANRAAAAPIEGAIIAWQLSAPLREQAQPTVALRRHMIDAARTWTERMGLASLQHPLS